MSKYNEIVEAVGAYIQYDTLLSSKNTKNKVQRSMSDHVCVHSMYIIMHIPEENCCVIEDVCCYCLPPTIIEVSRFIGYILKVLCIISGYDVIV